MTAAGTAPTVTILVMVPEPHALVTVSVTGKSPAAVHVKDAVGVVASVTASPSKSHSQLAGGPDEVSLKVMSTAPPSRQSGDELVKSTTGTIPASASVAEA